MSTLTTDLVRSLRRPRDPVAPDGTITRLEWLVTNGLGGYASGTVAGAVTRRYHGLLVASLPAPLGRMVLLNHLLERVRLPDGNVVWLGDEAEVAGPNAVDRTEHLVEFRLELGLPVWRYELPGVAIEKRVIMPYGQNTVHITYQLVEGAGPIRMSLRPSIQFRGYEASVNSSLVDGYQLTAAGHRYEVTGSSDLPSLRFMIHGDRAALTLDEKAVPSVPYSMERARGYDFVGSMWSPGYFRVDLRPDHPATLVASAEPWEAIQALPPSDAGSAEVDRRRRLLSLAGCGVEEGRPGDNSMAAELVLAADQFIITPAGRLEEAARARASGEDVRTVIAGYHWFTDWGRDTMISLDGLTLATRRYREAAYILSTFGQYVRDGLIPNMFPDGARDGLYHTADASLWFFHAVHRYTTTTGDRETLQRLLPRLTEIVRHHIAGTRFGIGVDPADGLLVQGADGYQLTWMDAKVDDWVVTPRRGKPVEINALWYNALRLLHTWNRELRRGRGTRSRSARRSRTAFIQRALLVSGGRLLDRRRGRPGRKRSGASAEPDPVVFARTSDPRPIAMGCRPDDRARQPSHAGRVAVARPRASRLQADLLRRSAFARCRLPSRDRVGLADRSVSRRLPESASRRLCRHEESAHGI